MSKVNISYGVCVDNKDPHNASRVRFFLLDNLPNKKTTIQDIVLIVKNSDNKNEYTPWDYATSNKNKDPFLCEPFLGKTMNSIPEKGQLLKILEYEDTPKKFEYVSAVVNDISEINQNYLVGSIKTRSNNKSEKGIIPSTDYISLNGKKNEQLLLGRGEIINRVGFIKNKNKASNYPFSQIVNFPIKFNLKNEERTVTNISEFLIDFVLKVNFLYEEKIDENHKNLIVNINIHNSGKYINNNGIRGLKNTGISFDDEFKKRFKEPSIAFTIKSKDIKNLLNEFYNVTKSFKNRKLYKFPKNSNSTNYEYSDNEVEIIINNDFSFDVNDGGSVPEIKNEIIVDNFLIISNETQENYNSYTEDQVKKIFGLTKRDFDINPLSDKGKQYKIFTDFKNFISEASYQEVVSSLKNTRNTVTETVDIFEEINESVSYHVTSTDKILLHSTSLDLPINSTKKNFEGADLETLTKLMKDKDFSNTHPIPRGDELIKTILTLIEMIKNHGHIAAVEIPDSLDENSRNTLSKIEEKLKDDLNNINSKNILNHHIRIN